MCQQIVLRPHSHVLKHNVNSVWLFLHSLSTFPCKIHYRIKRVYTGRRNKLQRWGERVIVKRTLPIPALKLTWGLLKLQPDIRLDKDARKGHYVATGDSIPLPYFTCPALVPSFQPWTCQGFSGWGAPWMQVSKRSPQTRPAPFSLGCPSLIPTFALSLTHARKNNKLGLIFAPNITLTTEELVRHYKSAPKSLDGFLLK